jgi:hypothetical protein
MSGRRATAIAGALASVLAGGACAVGPTGAGSFAYGGSWTYAGAQETPTMLTLAGPVSFVGTGDDAGFEGSIVLTETAPGGAVRILSGPASGLVLQDTILDFTTQFSGVARRHVGVARGDSIAGTWADGAGSVATGSFVLRRAGGG